MATARRLVERSGTAGMQVTVLGTSEISAFADVGRYFAGLLKDLGYRARFRNIPRADDLFSAMYDSSRRTQAITAGWIADYPAASNFLHVQFSCDTFVPNSLQNNNAAEFCDQDLSAEMRRALVLQVNDPPAAGEAWAAIDRKLVDQAVQIPTVNPVSVDLVSERLRNYVHNPQFGLLLAQTWVQ
jgi:peptide/nickel transport system substrate-binding protein